MTFSITPAVNLYTTGVDTGLDALDKSRATAQQAHQLRASGDTKKALKLYQRALELAEQSLQPAFGYKGDLYRALGEILRDDPSPEHTLQAPDCFRAAEHCYHLAGRPSDALDMRIAASSLFLDGKIQEVAEHEKLIRQLYADAVRERSNGAWAKAERFAQLGVIAIRKWSVIDERLEAEMRLERARARAMQPQRAYSRDFSIAAKLYADIDLKRSIRIRFEELASVVRDDNKKRVEQICKKLEHLRDKLTPKQIAVLDLHRGQSDHRKEGTEAGPASAKATKGQAAPLREEDLEAKLTHWRVVLVERSPGE